MLKAKTKGDSLYIDLAPNKSSSINENLVFFGFLSLICLTFGIGFFFIGATMILPFAGLEVLALILILRANRKWLNQKQALYLDKLYVELKEDNKKITFDRFLSKFLIEENNSKKELFIKSNNQKIEIGSFLNQEEKEQLIELLKKKVSDLNFS
jgi:Integral membrane protein